MDNLSELNIYTSNLKFDLHFCTLRLSQWMCRMLLDYARKPHVSAQLERQVCGALYFSNFITALKF